MFKLFYLLLTFLCFGTSCTSSEKTLYIYSWSGLFDPAIIKQFEAKYQCRVLIDTFESNETMYAKLLAGARGYDLIMPSNYLVEVMKEQGMLLKFDLTKIPNLKYLDRELTRLPSEQLEYGFPFILSFSGIGYRKDRVKELPPSWQVFQLTKLKERMTMLNDMREVLGAALLSLGYSLNTSNPKEVEAARDRVIEWKKNLAKFESEQYKNGIATAEYLAVQAYSGDIHQIALENPHVGFLFPEEGSIMAYDCLAIPLDAPHPELAHEFLNFIYEPKIAAGLIDSTHYLIPHTTAHEYLESNPRLNPELFPPPHVWNKSQVLMNLGPALLLYLKAWDEVKQAL